MKAIKIASVLIALSFALTGCQIGVLSADIGLGFEEGAYVISQ